MAVGEQFRLAQIYDSFYVGHSTPVRFRVALMKDDVPEPYDLTAFDSIELVVLDDNDAAGALLATFPMTVLTGAADLIDGVPARMSGDVLLTLAPEQYRMKLQGAVGTDWTIIQKPWQFSLFVAGPTS